MWDVWDVWIYKDSCERHKAVGFHSTSCTNVQANYLREVPVFGAAKTVEFSFVSREEAYLPNLYTEWRKHRAIENRDP